MSHYTDGNFSTPVFDRQTPDTYPFSGLGDTTTVLYRRTYHVDGAAYTPATFGSVDPDRADCYLIAESPLEWERGDRATFTRTYAKIPTDQVDYSSQPITKPEFSTFSGYVAGTYFDKALTLQGTADQLTRTGVYVHPQGAGRLYGPAKTSTSVNSASDTRITCVNHGVTASDHLLVRRGGTQYVILPDADYSVIDADTIDILGANHGTFIDRVLPYHRDYTPGTDRVRTKRTTRYYLPGVTGGITTPDDIPIVSPAFDPEILIDLILTSATGYQAYDAEDLRRWLDGPIYEQTTIQIDLDAL